MRTLYVHIGTPKTATTSIQMFCVENQKVLNKQSACLLTISDSMVSKKKTTSEEREKLFINMIEIALETALELQMKENCKFKKIVTIF